MLTLVIGSQRFHCPLHLSFHQRHDICSSGILKVELDILSFNVDSQSALIPFF